MRVTLLHLLELSRLDSEIIALRQEQRRLPEELEAETEALEAIRREIEEAAALAKEAQRAGDALVLEAKSLAADVDKLAAQLRAVKTNREYAVVTGQTKEMRARQSEFETKALEKFLQVDETTAANEKRRAEAEAGEKRLGERKREVERKVGEAAAKEKDLLIKRERLTDEIDSEALVKYERVLERRGDRAMVAADEGVCQACFMNLTPQEHNLVLLAEEVVPCKSCGRILYIEERLVRV